MSGLESRTAPTLPVFVRGWTGGRGFDSRFRHLAFRGCFCPQMTSEAIYFFRWLKLHVLFYLKYCHDIRLNRKIDGTPGGNWTHDLLARPLPLQRSVGILWDSRPIRDLLDRANCQHQVKLSKWPRYHGVLRAEESWLNHWFMIGPNTTDGTELATAVTAPCHKYRAPPKL